MAAFLHVLIFFPNNSIFIARKYTFFMKKIRLTESDLHNIIESAVRFIIQEKKDNADIIKWIAENLKKMEVNAEDGENMKPKIAYYAHFYFLKYFTHCIYYIYPKYNPIAA